MGVFIIRDFFKADFSVLENHLSYKFLFGVLLFFVIKQSSIFIANLIGVGDLFRVGVVVIAILSSFTIMGSYFLNKGIKKYFRFFTNREIKKRELVIQKRGLNLELMDSDSEKYLDTVDREVHTAFTLLVVTIIVVIYHINPFDIISVGAITLSIIFLSRVWHNLQKTMRHKIRHEIHYTRF